MSNNYRMKVSDVVFKRHQRSEFVLSRKDKRLAYYELIEPVTVTNDIISIEIPVGFRTDFASIPRFLWWLLPPDGEYAIAAIVHDYLLEAGYSRFLSDAIFRQLMRDMGVAWWKRLLIYCGVRFWSLITLAFIFRK